MTDRTVRVKLEASVDGYNRAMGSATERTRGLERQVDQTHAGVRRGMSGLAKAGTLAGGLVGASLGAMVASSVRAAASFETTMRQIAVATGAPASSIKGLSDLAMKMGQDTVFSAQDAGAAMLELAKGGLTEADIRAGALSSTLTLASAGGLQLGDAAGYIVQGLSTFNLSAAKASTVAAALAGGANASTASVQDMGLALSQVGPGAKLAGLSLQQTVGVLAAFAQNGIKGSDAGTSLKTMLSRLVPQTQQQAGAMKRLGLDFIDAKGNFLGIDQVAQQLHDHLGKLSESQRTAALNIIFGSDAARAAAVLMKEGAKGVRDYTAATSDQTQADRLAKAATSGTAGALSQLSGSIDTAKLKLGQALAPLIVDLATHMTTWANAVSTDVIPALASFIKGMEDGTGPGGQFRDVLDQIGGAAESAWHAAKPMLEFIGDHPKLFATVAKDALIFAGAMKVIGAVKSFPALGGGAGRIGGLGGAAASLTRPVPVLVTNPGFGTGGRGGGPTVIGGPKGPIPEGRFGKIMASSLTAQVVLMADVVLGQKAVSGLKGTVFNLHYNLSVNNAAKDFLNQINDPGTDRKTRAILQRHYNAVFAGAAEASRTGNTKVLQDALNATYADLARNAAAIQKQIAHDTAVNTANNVKLISGGLLTVADLASTTSKHVATQLDSGLGGGLGRARERAEDLAGSLRAIPQPKVNASGLVDPLQGGVDKAHQFLLTLGQIPRRKEIEVRASLITSGKSVTIGTVHSSGGTLYVQGEGGKKLLAAGGPVYGPGTGTSDSIPAMLSNGEYVVNAAAASQHRHLLDLINGGTLRPWSSMGGSVDNSRTFAPSITVQQLPGENTVGAATRALRDQAFLAGMTS